MIPKIDILLTHDRGEIEHVTAPVHPSVDEHTVARQVREVHRAIRYDILGWEETPPIQENRLPEGSAERKNFPMAEGLLDYFPDALAAVAAVSKAGNDKHNPGQPMHHARGKSMDHADCIVRHLVDRGGHGSDGMRHSASLAWRALALLQEELEAENGLTLPRGAKAPE